MVALARLMVIGFVVLTVIYVSLSLYSRSVRRSKLKTWWEEEGQARRSGRLRGKGAGGI